MLSKIRYHLANRAFDGLCALGMGGRWLADRPGGRILVYHGIDQCDGSGFNARFVGVERFREHMLWFREHYRLVSLAEFLEGDRHPSRFALALTFDDGYAGAFELALPILQELEIPATFFVTTVQVRAQEFLWADLVDITAHTDPGPIEIAGATYRRDRRGELVDAGDGTPLKTRCRTGSRKLVEEVTAVLAERSRPVLLDEAYRIYWKLVEPEALRAAAASPLFTVGSHGVSHVSLGCVSEEVAREELSESKRWLEEQLQTECVAVAFPDGSHTPAVRQLAREAGYRYLLGHDPDLWEGEPAPGFRGRLTVNPFVSTNNLVRCIHAGRY